MQNYYKNGQFRKLLGFYLPNYFLTFNTSKNQ